MDQNVIDAVWAVPLWDDSSGYWFTALCATVERQTVELREVDWEEFATELHQQASTTGFSPDVTTAFVDHLSAQFGDPLDTIQQMYELGVDQFVELHRQAYPPGDDSQAAPDPETPDVSSYPVLQEGDTGEWVDYLDQMLTHHGF